MRGEWTAYRDLFTGPMAEWFKHFLPLGVPRMRAVAASGAACGLLDRHPGGHSAPCPLPAAFVCTRCRRPVCPSHAFIFWTGDAICPECVQSAAPAAAPPPWSPGAGPPPGQRPPPGPDPRVAESLVALGLTPPVSWEAVESRWKSLVRDHHPDRYPPHQRAEQEERTKRINAAYQFLKELRDKKAGAP